MNIEVLTLFPEFFDGPLGASVLGRAIEEGHLRVELTQIREFATDKHRTVDDNPYGGGAGMLMRPTELGAAVEAARGRQPDAMVLLLSPQGRTLEHGDVERLAALDALVLVCGRYEGVDERFVERHVDAEVSIGDFVLTGGEPAALCLIDAVSRYIPEVLGNQASLHDESFAGDLLEYPQFTRPAVYEGQGIPEVLLSGHHAKIESWRRKVSLLRTLARRPDRLTVEALGDEDRKLLADPSLEVPSWLLRPRHLAWPDWPGDDEFGTDDEDRPDDTE